MIRDSLENGFSDVEDLFRAAGIGLSFVNPEGRIIWANPAAHLMLGFGADDYVGHPMALFHSDPRQAEALLDAICRGDAVRRSDATLRCRDNHLLHVELTASPTFGTHGGNGELLYSRCLTVDITARRRAEQNQELLVRAGQELSTSLEMRQTLEILGRLVVPRFADWYTVHLRGEDGVIAPAHIAHADPGLVDKAWEAARRWPGLPDDGSGIAAVLNSGEPRVANGIADDQLRRLARDSEHLDLLRRAGIRSVLIVPLNVAGDTIGTMSFIGTQPGFRYGDEELRVAESLANRAALAISNARLHEEANAARIRAERATQRMTILGNASKFIADSLDPDAALINLARFVADNVADYCVTYRLDGAHDIRRVGVAHVDARHQSDVESLVLLSPPSLHDEFGVGAVVRTGHPVLASEVTDAQLREAAVSFEQLNLLRRLAPVSSMIVPLQARGRTFGAVALASTDLSARRYVEADLELAQEMAGRVALLIDNARLLCESRTASEAREQALAVVSHELRNPLNTIVSACALLNGDVTPLQRTATYAGIRRAATQMTRLVDDLLEASRLESGRLGLSIAPTDLDEVIRDTVTLFRPVAADRKVRLDHVARSSPSISIEADESRIGQALSNLIDNALSVTPGGGEVKVISRADDAWLRITVQDSGPGINPEHLPHLFDRYWQSDPEGRKGLGLGLAIARAILEAHGGTIEVSSCPGAGAAFSLVLPLRARAVRGLDVR